MSTSRKAPPRIGSIILPSIDRAERRANGTEKPIPLPWPVLEPHFGGGLWPGLHVVNKATGVGGTQLALQVAVQAAVAGYPSFYAGLELGALDLALRLVGEVARVPWSAMWTGTAGPAYFDRARREAAGLEHLPFHFEVASPNGFPPSALLACVESMRAQYAEKCGPGSRPMLVVVDFLQLLGEEHGQAHEQRARVGRASYVLRDIANRLNVSVLCISSVARERYTLLSDIRKVADLRWDDDADEKPTNRTIGNTDAIVGSGKESGEIEYSADSVSVLARIPATFDGKGSDVVFATAKGRATGPTWSPLHFTGFRYDECPDEGGRLVQAWRESDDRKQRVAEEKQTAKDNAKASKIGRDAEAIRAFVAANPGCSVREARATVVADNPKRWGPAVAVLGPSLRQSPTTTTKGRMVALFVEGGDGVDVPPHTPPPSTSTGGRPEGLPVELVDRCGRPQPSTTSTTPNGNGQA